jgi:asparagine synthase (glutamine-hydrolysing)
MEINISLSTEFGWKQYSVADYTVWFKGYLINGNVVDLFQDGHDLLQNKNINVDVFAKWIKSVRGHFSIIIFNCSRVFCAVDQVRSVPIFYNYDNNQISITANAAQLSNEPELDLELDNAEAALEIAMSGYTIGKKTLSVGISQLQAGECILVDENTVTIYRYYRYSPWNTCNDNKDELKVELTQLLKDMFKSVAESCAGRQIVIPLSGGHDSRLIASGLKEVGFQDVVCFSYGLSNNFEAKAAKKIADKLGYKYVFIPLTLKKQRDYFSQNSFSEFWDMTNTLSNSPVLIDYSAVKQLIEGNHIARDAIFINGNSGDFISGGHVAPQHKELDLDSFVETIMQKHYSLWKSLRSPKNDKKIRIRLKEIITKIMSDYCLSQDDFCAIAESIEWSGRQSKFVTTTQRSYEFHGHEWRLPLWDPLFMEFWEKIPQSYKVNQSLYKEVLYQNNWGNVWDNIQVNDFRLASYKIRILRSITKLFFLLTERASWNKFDKRVFSYFYDNTAATAIEPYRNVLLDRNGARDRNSWISRRYLSQKDIELLDLQD